MKTLITSLLLGLLTVASVRAQTPEPDNLEVQTRVCTRMRLSPTEVTSLPAGASHYKVGFEYCDELVALAQKKRDELVASEVAKHRDVGKALLQRLRKQQANTPSSP